MSKQDNFKRDNKPASCSRAPWAAVIESGKRDSIMRQIRIECLQIYGYEMDTCPKKEVCIGKECLGRELPWKSPTAKPYLEKMKKQGLIAADDLFYVKGCELCPIKATCTSVCPMMNDFLSRHISKQPDLVYQETLDNHVIEVSEEPSEPSFFEGRSLPWDCLEANREAVVRLRMYQRKDFLTIATKCGLYDQSQCRYIFYSSLTKLAEYAILREFIKEKGKDLTLDQKQILTKRYIENKDLKDIASERGTSIQNIQQIINRIINKYSLDWPKYAKRQGNKIIYNIPEVLR